MIAATATTPRTAAHQGKASPELLVVVDVAGVVGAWLVAAGVVVVWAVPVERILGSSISAAPHWLPGLMLEALSVGDTKTATTSRVLVVVSLYAVALLAIAILDFRHRDVTA